MAERRVKYLATTAGTVRERQCPWRRQGITPAADGSGADGGPVASADYDGAAEGGVEHLPKQQ
jgi:hypothetical protein